MPDIKKRVISIIPLLLIITVLLYFLVNQFKIVQEFSEDYHKSIYPCGHNNELVLQKLSKSKGYCVICGEECNNNDIIVETLLNKYKYQPQTYKACIVNDQHYRITLPKFDNMNNCPQCGSELKIIQEDSTSMLRNLQAGYPNFLCISQ